MFNFWWLAGLVNRLEPHLPPLSSQKNEMLIFRLHSTSNDQPSWLMDSNPIHHPSPAKKWNTHFWITFNFWWLARLVDGLEPHLPPLSSQKKMKCSFWITFNFWWLTGLVKGLKPHLPPLSSQKKMKRSFLDYIQLLMIGWVILVTNGDWNAKKRPPKSSKNDMFIFWWSARRLQEDHQKTSGSLLTLWYKEISMKDYTSTWTAVS